MKPDASSDKVLNAIQLPSDWGAVPAKSLSHIALFAALTGVLGLVPIIPLPLAGVTFSLQTLGVLLAGGIIGSKRGALAMGLVILLVAIGLPVLTGAQGGFAKLIGPTAGFIWSWPLSAFLTGTLVRLCWSKLTYPKAVGAALVGSVSLYPLGQSWLAIQTAMAPPVALWSWLVYLPGDIVKSLIAAGAIVLVKRAYPLISLEAAPT